jgi:hypothetical protein
MPKLPESKSLFASFSSEKEEAFVLFLKKKNQKDFYLLAASLAMVITCNASAEPVLKHVVLSSGGVGLFAFTAEANGAATLRLSVKLDQVDDILKSLTVTDPAGPMVSLRLAGREPLAESFKTLPFRPGDFASAEALLGALVGEQVRIPLTGASGSILAVSPFQQAGGTPNQASVERHRLTIATSQGIETVVLEDTPTIEFASEKLRAQVTAALSAIAAQRVQDKRTLEITLAQGDARIVQIAYVVQAPVWKTSYRITLPPEGETAPAHLQAYAVIENLSGLDWKNVDVDLTSGRPALFHTPLYRALFADRPEAPVDLPGLVAPPPDNAPVAMAAGSGDVLGSLQLHARRALPSFAPALAAPAPAPPPPPAPPPAQVEPSAAQVDFHLAAPITAASGESLLVPVIDRPITAERVDVYDGKSDKDHPLVALKISNESAGALPPGVITLYQLHGNATGYIGDARIDTIEPGETRFASFAADLPVSVQESQSHRNEVTSIKAAKGTLTITRQDFATKTYTITTPKSGGRKLVIETIRDTGEATVIEPTTGVQISGETVRVSADVPAGATRTIRVTDKWQTSGVEALTPDSLTSFAYLATSNDAPPAIRDAMRHAQDLRDAVDAQQQTVDRLKTEDSNIVDDQTRIRENLAAVPPNSDSQRRYLATLSDQEFQLTALRAQKKTAQSALESAQKTLSDYLSNLTL